MLVKGRQKCLFLLRVPLKNFLQSFWCWSLAEETHKLNLAKNMCLRGSFHAVTVPCVNGMKKFQHTSYTVKEKVTFSCWRVQPWSSASRWNSAYNCLCTEHCATPASTCYIYLQPYSVGNFWLIIQCLFLSPCSREWRERKLPATGC